MVLLGVNLAVYTSLLYTFIYYDEDVILFNLGVPFIMGYYLLEGGLYVFNIYFMCFVFFMRILFMLHNIFYIFFYYFCFDFEDIEIILHCWRVERNLNLSLALHYTIAVAIEFVILVVYATVGHCVQCGPTSQ